MRATIFVNLLILFPPSCFPFALIIILECEVENWLKIVSSKSSVKRWAAIKSKSFCPSYFRLAFCNLGLKFSFLYSNAFIFYYFILLKFLLSYCVRKKEASVFYVNSMCATGWSITEIKNNFFLDKPKGILVTLGHSIWLLPFLKILDY